MNIELSILLLVDIIILALTLCLGFVYGEVHERRKKISRRQEKLTETRNALSNKQLVIDPRLQRIYEQGWRDGLAKLIRQLKDNEITIEEIENEIFH